MEITTPRMPPRIRPSVRLGLAFAFVFLMFNLDALIDSAHHPEIPYFDLEHFITGGVIALITGILIGLLELYIQRLERALESVKTLEGMLPICSSCKKIRTPDNDWHVIEKYIKERTDATFTHSLCPECVEKLYGEKFKAP